MKTLFLSCWKCIQFRVQNCKAKASVHEHTRQVKPAKAEA